MVRTHRRRRGSHHLGHSLCEADDHERIRRRRESRTAWGCHGALDGGISGESLRAPVRDAQPDRAIAGNVPMGAHGFSLAPPSAARHSGQFQPQGTYLRSRRKEESLFPFAKGVPGKQRRPCAVGEFGLEKSPYPRRSFRISSSARQWGQLLSTPEGHDTKCLVDAGILRWTNWNERSSEATRLRRTAVASFDCGLRSLSLASK